MASSKLKQEINEQMEKNTFHTTFATNKNEELEQLERDRKALEYYNNLSDIEKYSFQEELRKKRIRDNYANYVQYVYGDNYTMTKFHKALCNIAQTIVDRVERGEQLIVCLSVPPQFGKSMTITECLPSWFAMRNPDKGVILCSYNADFAERFGDSNRQKVKEFGKDLFGLEISDSQDNKTLFQFKGHRGQVLSTGIFGTLTGNPASILIIDDPYKSNLEAESLDYRNKVLSVVKSSAETRLSPLGSALIIIHTRWHEDDLIGYYMKQDKVIYINIPCVWEKGVDKLLHRKVGETLSPELGHTIEWVMNKKKSLGQRLFSALFQGNPYVEGGNIIKREYIKYYDKYSKPPMFDEMVISCDLSFGATSKDSDPNAIVVWGRLGANHYLIDWWNKKCGFQETINMIKMYRSNYQQCRKILIERKANGMATIELLQQHITGVVPFDPKMNSKEVRLKLVAPFFESGNIYFPNESLKENVEDFVSQLLKFPNMAHDEYVDTTSQYLLDYQYKEFGAKIGTSSIYAEISNAVRDLKI